MQIAPSILSADFSELKKELDSIHTADWIHIDVMDGHFVKNITIGPLVIKSIRKHSKKVFDTHLMIEDANQYAEAFIKAGSDQLTFHIEACDNPLALIKKIKALGAKAGLSIKPNTPVETLNPYLNHIDLILIMSVEPGFGGQTFMEESLEKIAYLATYKKNHNLTFDIVVDGGINEETGTRCAKAGATCLVAGSFIFNQKDRLKAIESLRK
ncbi:MAG: ribulose-phosphate 3-epimerase [Candidatus Izemoplasmataceae bacterium]